MLVQLLGLACCLSVPGSLSSSTENQFNWANELGISPVVPQYYPSTCDSGGACAFLVKHSDGSSAVYLSGCNIGHVCVPCSSGIQYCSRPRISRDGHWVTYFGVPQNAQPPNIVLAIVCSTASGSTPIVVPNYSTTLWDPQHAESEFALQPPGIVDDSSGQHWTISYGELAAPLSGGGCSNPYIWTAAGTASGATSVSPTYPCQSLLDPTDMSNIGGSQGIVYVDGPAAQLFYNGYQITNANAACLWPSVSGEMVAFESSATNLGGPLQGSNVYVGDLTLHTFFSPYSLDASNNNAGSATHPFISGETCVFNTTSTHLVFDQSYAFSGAGSYAVQAQSNSWPWVSSSTRPTMILSCDYSNMASPVAYPAANACTDYPFAGTIGLLNGAFESTAPPIAPITSYSGFPPSGVNLIFVGFTSTST